MIGMMKGERAHPGERNLRGRRTDFRRDPGNFIGNGEIALVHTAPGEHGIIQSSHSFNVGIVWPVFPRQQARTERSTDRN